MGDASGPKDTEAAVSLKLTLTREWPPPNSEHSTSLRDRDTSRELSRTSFTTLEEAHPSLRLSSETNINTSTAPSISSPSKVCTPACLCTLAKKQLSKLAISCPSTPCLKELSSHLLKPNTETEVPLPAPQALQAL